MASITKEEIGQLQQQLKEKTEELKVIYNRLIEAGVIPLPDDYLDFVSGGVLRTNPPVYYASKEKNNYNDRP